MAYRLLEDLRSQLLLGFRTRKWFYVSSVGAAVTLWVQPFTGIVIPSSYRFTFAVIFVIPLMAGLVAAWRFFGAAITSNVEIVTYNMKHKPEKSIDPDITRLAASRGVEYRNPIYLTDNPKVDSPFTNPLKKIITFPRSWNSASRYTREQFLGGGMHEIGHIKFRNQFYRELAGALGLTLVFSLFLNLRLALPIVMISEIAFLMLAFTVVSHRSELRCDRFAAEVMGKDAVISLLEDLGRRYGFNSGSETHPPIRYRIEALRRL
jgi:Peptidase family M48